VTREGRPVLQLCASAADDIYPRQMVKVKPHTSYLLSGWVKTHKVKIEEDGGNCGANLSNWFTYERSRSLTGDNDWTYLALGDSTPATASRWKAAPASGSITARRRAPPGSMICVSWSCPNRVSKLLMQHCKPNEWDTRKLSHFQSSARTAGNVGHVSRALDDRFRAPASERPLWVEMGRAEPWVLAGGVMRAGMRGPGAAGGNRRIGVFREADLW